jgi:hypothetical protein
MSRKIKFRVWNRKPKSFEKILKELSKQEFPFEEAKPLNYFSPPSKKLNIFVREEKNPPKVLDGAKVLLGLKRLKIL